MKTKQIALASVLIGLGAIGMAAEKKKDVDSILDRLEKRLMDQEQGTLSFGEEVPADKKSAKDSAVTVYEYEGSVIQAPASRSKPLADVEEAVDHLERDIAQLSSDVQAHRQKILESSRIDNLVEIMIDLGEDEKSALRTVDVEIDGVNIYRLNQDTGYWLNQKTMPVYWGPMKPGKHELIMTARVARKSADKITFDAAGYGSVTQSFSFSIPDGQSKQRFAINVRPPEKGSDQAKATWSELTKK